MIKSLFSHVVLDSLKPRETKVGIPDEFKRFSRMDRPFVKQQSSPIWKMVEDKIHFNTRRP